MNWKSQTLHSQFWNVTCLGAGAGLWAAFLAEGALLLGDRMGVAWVRTFLPVLVLGLVFGALFSPIPELLNRRFRRAARAALVGALVTGPAGVLAFVLLAYLTDVRIGNAGGGASAMALNDATRWVWFGASLAVMAAGAALASSASRLHWHQGLQRALRALVPGALLGAALAASGTFLRGEAWLLLLGMALWGGAEALAVFWLELRLARHWLRVLIGPGEDRFFPLDRRRITLGRVESNDIPLLEGQEVYPHHCEIKWAHDHYEIIDDEQGGVVLVNFRQIQEHPLKPGDLVKIGSVLLQYGEGARP